LPDVVGVAGASRLAGRPFTVWPQVEHEADDGMAAAAAMAAADERVSRVLICTPDKDLGQCVGGKVVQFDRRKGEIFDGDGVRARLGVAPESVADLLALVGDSADGFPGLPGWGAKSAATVLSRWPHLEDIPADVGDWDVTVRSAAKLNATLREQFELALLFRRIATVVPLAPVSATVDEIRWTGPADPDAFAALCDEIAAPTLAARIQKLVPRLP
jgi:5'-3' exonuclease